jgi:hypothetical protein
VQADAPQYPRLLEVTKTADPADWKLDESGRPGIWIELGLFYGSTRYQGSTSTMDGRRTQSERKQKEQEIANEASALPDLQANGGENCKGWDSVGRLVDSHARRGSVQPPTPNGSAQPPTPDVLRNEPTSTGRLMDGDLLCSGGLSRGGAVLEACCSRPAEPRRSR